MPKLTLLLVTLMALALPGNAFGRALDEHFGSGNSCYERTYSSSHLKKHPRQIVTYIRFDHFPTTYGTHGPDGKVAFNEKTGIVYFLISVRLRGSNTLQTNSGECRPAGTKLKCQIECDGGGFEIKSRDNRSILIVNTRGFVVSGCGGKDYRKISHKTDDKLFRLDRVAAARCVPSKKID